MITYFGVVYRDKGHWDIVGEGKRLFCIRGGLGEFRVRDERQNQKCPIVFPTVDAAMAWICSTLMYEPCHFDTGLDVYAV